MKKLGLCIVYKNWNYGSILQSYATLLKLKELNIEYEIIRYEKKKNLRFYLASIPRLMNSSMIYSKARSLKRYFGKMIHPEFKENDKFRSEFFLNFIKNNFDNFSERIREYDELCTYATRYYDTVLVGSDQLWLPSGLASNFYNLMFVPNHINKIAYSASFGVSKIPFYQKKRTSRFLERIEYISVRERSGQQIVYKLTGRKVPIVLDPTLIVTKETWDKNIPNKKLINDEYIFCYFLGNNPSHRQEALKLKKETGLKIVTLRHMDEYIKLDEKFGDYTPYNIGPAEFVNLIRHASYICTDSFHGSVFSIINHKLFISFNRYSSKSINSRNSRIDTLLKQLGLEDRRFAGDIITQMMKPIDYNAVEGILCKMRENSVTFLKSALNKNK